MKQELARESRGYNLLSIFEFLSFDGRRNSAEKAIQELNGTKVDVDFLTPF